MAYIIFPLFLIRLTWELVHNITSKMEVYDK